MLLLLLLQGKLEADARAALIAKGQQLKQQLEEVEAKLAQVGGSICSCSSGDGSSSCLLRAGFHRLAAAAAAAAAAT
jgi:hypothetical protein